MKPVSVRIALLSLIAIALVNGSAIASVVCYPAPTGATLSTDYTVTADGQAVAVYQGPGRTGYGGNYSYAYFDFSGTVNVEITTAKSLSAVKVRPESKGIQKTVSGNKLTFSLSSSPTQLSIEPDGINGPLLLFANPPEVNPPKQGDPGVIFYGPGIYKPNTINLTDNQTLYIAGGAIVQAGVTISGRTNVKILGRGILDGETWARFAGPTPYIVDIENSKNISFQGIIVKDSWSWSFVLKASDSVTISNIKIIGTRFENQDGIDIVNSGGVTIDRCFLRTDDDNIATKGNGLANDKNTENILITNCCFWSDRAGTYCIGDESLADSMKNIVSRNCDVLHLSLSGKAFCWMHCAEDMVTRDVRFEDIRINTELLGAGQPRFITVETGPDTWMPRNNTPGYIRNIYFKNITLTGRSNSCTYLIKVSGYSPQYNVDSVTFENVTVNGVCETRTSPNVNILANTSNIQLICSPVSTVPPSAIASARLRAPTGAVSVEYFGLNGRLIGVDANSFCQSTGHRKGLRVAIVRLKDHSGVWTTKKQVVAR
jgi:hypothetical protein